MYKAHYVGNNTDIFMSEHHGKNAPHVVEIGHSTPPHGYESKPLCRNVWVLHYVVSGEGLYFGQPVTGPCVFIETPDTVQFYAVSDNASAPAWEQYWIMFDGQTAPDWLAYAGFPKVPTVLPCPYMHQAQSIFSELLTSSNYIGQNDHYYMLSGLCRLFALHAATKEKAPRSDSAYVRKIRAYIHDNYATIRSEAELADLVHLSTRYMNKIFKKASLPWLIEKGRGEGRENGRGGCRGLLRDSFAFYPAWIVGDCQFLRWAEAMQLPTILYTC